MWICTCNESYFRGEDISIFNDRTWVFNPPEIDFGYGLLPLKDLEITLHSLEAMTKKGSEFYIGFSENKTDIKNCIEDIINGNDNELITYSKYNLNIFSKACKNWICKTYADHLTEFYLSCYRSGDTLLKALVCSKILNEFLEDNIGDKKINEIYREWVEKDDFRYP